MRRTTTRPRMSGAEITPIVDKLADIVRVLQDADPDDKAEIFRPLGLRLTYHPDRQLVEAQIEALQHWYSDSVRGDLNTNSGEIPRIGEIMQCVKGHSASHSERRSFHAGRRVPGRRAEATIERVAVGDHHASGGAASFHPGGCARDDRRRRVPAG